MNLFRQNIFKKKKKEEPVKKQGSVVCGYCNEDILSHEPRIKKKGMSFHRRCFKKVKREAIKKIYG